MQIKVKQIDYSRYILESDRICDRKYQIYLL